MPGASEDFVRNRPERPPKLRRMKVGIVGLGYVGLPLAAAFVEAGHDVVGVDSSGAKVERLRRSESDVIDVPSERLRAMATRFTASDDHRALAGCESIAICVPTDRTRARWPRRGWASRSRASRAAG